MSQAPGGRTGSDRVIHGPGTAQTKITLGQRALLHQWRTEGMAEDAGHRAYPWRTISPADPGQD